MKKQKAKILFLCLALVVLALFSLNIEKVRAGVSDNVWGWAWSENIGWISFNNTSGGGSVNYGVHITEVSATTGVFSGYAYYDINYPGTLEQETGWISFNRIDTGDPPGLPDYSTHLAQVNLQTGEISGWAKSLTDNDNWDGWIKLRNYSTDAGVTYGVSIDRDTGEFHGWAWGGSIVGAGWVSFNCAEAGENGENICSQSDYKVETSLIFNQAPEARNLSVVQDNYCHYPYPPVFLSWEFYDPGDTQSAYQVQVDNGSDFSSPENDSGKVSGSSFSYAPINLAYSTTSYYWRAKVWDSQDVQSDCGNLDGWCYPPNNTTISPFPTPPPGNPFATQVPYPIVDFTWNPLQPSMGEEVYFTDQSEGCGGAIIVSRSWVFENGEPPSSTDNELFPIVTFTAIGAGGQNAVTLTVTDDHIPPCSCSLTKYVPLSFPLPEWREVKPF